MPKYIFVTGGVVSSVGKGITTAALGRILKSRSLSVSIQKLDPYLNVDPGTMSPYQHGEVFVTMDGAETDLDLGHYERFIDAELTRLSSVTAGQIHQAVIARERRGDYLGRTIQTIPHVTDEIKQRIRLLGKTSGADVLIIEVGGTVGDIEGQPFLEAIRQMRHEEAREDTLSIHVTFLPYIAATQELKTKPTQHSVRDLRSIGIQPDVIVARSDHPVPADIRGKVALFCDVEPRAVVPLETLSSIYEVPLALEAESVGNYIVERMHLPAAAPELSSWAEMVQRLRQPQDYVEIAIAGKYVELPDAYISVKEALTHAAVQNGVGLRVRWVHAEALEGPAGVDLLRDVDGIVVPGGFGERGIEGKILAADYAWDEEIPYLGLCLGMQVMVVAAARRRFQSREPNSTEFQPGTAYPVISLLSEQEGIEDKGGTMRLGAYPCRLMPGSKAYEAYGREEIVERHRHRYEFNNAFAADLAEVGLMASGRSPDGTLVEISEVAGHPWMVGSQFHPEFGSRPNAPHPLFSGFVRAALERARVRRRRTTAAEALETSGSGVAGS
ncbi:MAG TPA: CTP synthase [Dehalococcoidia bacterium]|nr:CTP synthase [Dehalococcoidia bacterium]